ncbi:GAF domain-containing protein [Persicobacter diffluens]|uniref:GAF domain-containing protein n=1 Tax=Persicobacter diffluens TaxID=981 RepID=A0AAN5AJY0_9BACT|nr:hypothetical protein PEDI_20310 [Persicobacter diffluens]
MNKKRTNKPSFQRALLLPLGSMMTLLVLLVVALWYRQQAQKTEHFVKEEKMPLVVNSLKEKLRSSIDKPIGLGKAMEVNPFVVELMTSQKLDTLRFKKLIQQTKEGLDLFHMNFYLANSGAILDDRGYYKMASVEEEEDQWIFRTVADEGSDFSVNIGYLDHLQQYAFFINKKIYHPESGAFLGLCGIGIEIPEVVSTLVQYQSGQSGRNYIISGQGELKVYDENRMPAGNLFEDKAFQNLANAIRSGALGFVSADKGKEEEIWFYVQRLPDLDWYVVMEVHASEVLADLKLDLIYILGFGFLALIIILSVLGFFIRRTNQAIQQLIQFVENVNAGQAEMTLNSNLAIRELEMLQKSFHQFFKSISEATIFAAQIAKGNLEASHYQLSGENDRLGKALTSMKNALAQNRAEEERRNWGNEGMAQFADLLRNQNLGVQELSELVLSRMIKYLGLNQGAVFLVKTTADEEVLQLSACYAYNRKKHMEKEIAPGEGLVGQCYLEKEAIFMTDLPADYIHITSGLGKACPSNLYLVPLNHNDQVVGVMELAGFEILADYKRELVSKICQAYASTLVSVMTNENTKKLLEETQLQAEQLRAQEEEMRQNMEEMMATQEEMRRVNEALEANV